MYKEFDNFDKKYNYDLNEFNCINKRASIHAKINGVAFKLSELKNNNCDIDINSYANKLNLMLYRANDDIEELTAIDMELDQMINKLNKNGYTRKR